MTLKELAKNLKTPLGNLIRKAQQKGLKIKSDAPLTEAQIELLKATDETPQLKPAADCESKGELEIKPESTPAAPPASISIASVKQQQLSQSIAAENEQFNYHAHTRLQQSFTEGQELGILEALAEQDGRLNGKMAVQQVIFNSEMNRRANSLAEVANAMGESDFFGVQQSTAESYWKSSQVGASSNSELNQILKNLAKN